MVAPNMPAPSPSYVAVLKAKQGELLAIQTTAPDSFVPLLEVVDLQKANAIARGWPHAGHVVWVQPVNWTGVADATWANRTTTLFTSLRTAGVDAVPVVTLDETASLYAAVAATVKADKRGVVLRIDCEEALEETPAALTTAIDQTLQAVGVTAAQADLVLDAGLVSGGVAVQSTAALTALNALPHLTQWRNVVTAFSAFPKLVGEHVPPSSVGSIPRTDAAAFNQLSSRWTTRTLVYADYGVGVPTYSDVSWSPIPNIRYAVPGEWVVHRAATKNNPSPQYVQLAKDVVAAPYFAGASFSPGDAYIAAVATGADGPGNAGSYLKTAMSRHFHVVLDSLATHGAP
ncbi:beta family protein [Aeromicrobium sp. 9AM]|uniref:beta family protein n=1 Tax=Aeromicrobium sp. 9AM TaxID=2653126 RepID=UPI0012F08E97|nr:beta family protein [Aeromicrobium sp. 9AM]VXB03576.1 conserved hypothetical protein [Aeromicrobium sp. 9AM]